MAAGMKWFSGCIFLTSKFWQAFLNELEFLLAELGQALSTEDGMISWKVVVFL